jgi:hypothetical protein
VGIISCILSTNKDRKLCFARVFGFLFPWTLDLENQILYYSNRFVAEVNNKYKNFSRRREQYEKAKPYVADGCAGIGCCFEYGHRCIGHRRGACP